MANATEEHVDATALAVEDAAPETAKDETLVEDGAERDDAAEKDAPAPEAGEGAPEVAAVAAEPRTIGYRTFANGSEAYTYFQTLHSKLRKYQNLNEYEYHMVLELIKSGHPEAERKLSKGARALQIRDVERDGLSSSCFFVVHDDGGAEDVSYRKCIVSLFPEMAEKLAGPTAGAGKKRARDSPAAGASKGAKGGRGGRGGRGGARGRGRR